MSYKKAGVNEEKAAEWVKKIEKTVGLGTNEIKENIVSRVGDYASVYKLSDDNWIAAACDGVGTKLLWTLKGHGNAAALAQDLLAMNANDLLCVGADPILFLDYIAVGDAELLSAGGKLEPFITSLHSLCLENSMMLVGGETAQMPDLYDGEYFDLAGFAIGKMAPSDYLDINNVNVGDELWGWKSDGPHSNGFTWLRKIYGDDESDFIAEHLMPPTKLYIKDFKSLKSKVDVKYAYHITGTGLVNLLRSQPDSYDLGYEIENWPLDAVWIKNLLDKKLDLEELFKAFNMGVGFTVVVDPSTDKSLLEKEGLMYLGKVTKEKSVKIKDFVIKE